MIGVRRAPSVSEGDGLAGITQGVAPFVGRCSVPIGGEPTARGPATREVFSGSACTLTHG
jgi:hypothetical protein